MNQPYARHGRDPCARLRVNTCEDRVAAGSLLDAWLGTLLATAAPDPLLPGIGDPNGLVSIGQRAMMTTGSGDWLGPDADRWGDDRVQVVETKTTRDPSRSEPASSRLWTSIEDPLASDALPGVSAGGRTHSTQLPLTADSLAAEVTPSPTDTEAPSSTGGVLGASSAVPLRQAAESPSHGDFVAPTVVALGGGTGPPATQVAGGTIREVTFSGSGLITIEADPGDPAYPAPPHWLDSDTNGVLDQPADRSLPVGYSRGDTARVSAVFKANYVDPNLLLPGYAFTSPQVRGDGPGSYDVPATSVSLQGTDLVLGATDLYAPFANQVAYFEAFAISWETSLVVNTTTGERSWDPAGASSNELFVTLDNPVTSPVYITPIWHFCSTAAGMDNEPDSISKAWQPFADRKVDKVTKNEKGEVTARERLHYYKDWSLAGPNHVKPEDLLKNKDGTCHSWAGYLKMMLEEGGVKAVTDPHEVRAANLGDQMLIKNWTFVGDGTSVLLPGYPYQNKLLDPTKQPLGEPGSICKQDKGVWSYVWGATVEMKDEEGVPGQGPTTNPRALFENHIIVRIGGAGDYYDPSYGSKYASVQAWEDGALAGLVKQRADPNPADPNTNIYHLLGRKPNPAAADVVAPKITWYWL